MAIEPYDVVIAGGGPAGLSGALALGRARKRVLLCDITPARNATAVEVHNFVTRDGVPPAEFRRIAREQLAAYPNVEVRDVRVHGIQGERGRFEVRLESGTVAARRILLCTGMIDEPPDIDGLRALWGHSIFMCPYCHGWEVQDRRFAYLATSAEGIEFALFLRGWTSDVAFLTNARVELTDEQRARLAAAGVPIETRRIVRLEGHDSTLTQVEFADGPPLERDVLFMHPPQRQVDLVTSLGLALDAKGYVQVHESLRETSIPGIYAAGDLTTPMQAAILGAASGMQAAAALNKELTVAGR